MTHNEVYERIDEVNALAWDYVRRKMERGFPDEDLEDIVQEIVLRCLRFSDCFDPSKGRLSTWVNRAGDSALQEVFRRRNTAMRGGRSRVVSLDHGLAEALLAPQTLIENALWRADAVWVRDSAQKRLNDRERRMLYLRFHEDLTFDECGRDVGVGRERARQIVYMALRKLRLDARYHADTY